MHRTYKTKNGELSVEWYVHNHGVERRDAIFYTGEGNIADITLKVGELDWTIRAYCDGETRIRDLEAECDYYTPSDFIHSPYDTDEKIADGINQEKLEVINNSWFDFYTMDGEHLDYVTHSIEDMLSGAEALLSEMMFNGNYFNWTTPPPPS